MRLGVECLLTDDPARALNIAQELDTLNRERREIESGMQEQALRCSNRWTRSHAPGVALVRRKLARRRRRHPRLAHQGQAAPAGIRLRPGEGGIVKGSGRSIPGLHLRDALDLVAKRAPGLLVRFGGHAMAAGVTLKAGDFERFQACSPKSPANSSPRPISPARWKPTARSKAATSLETAKLLENEIWGQGFPAPLFCDEFDVEQQRVLKEKHLKLKLRKGNTLIEAIQFNFSTQPGHSTRAAYRLSINEYMGVENPQLMIEHLE
jgi:single-stranded-DNA-specific exonuclease